MANEVKIKVTVDNASGKPLADVKRDMGDVETASDKAGNKIREFGRHTSSIKGDLADLDRGLKKSKESLHSLGDSMDGSKSKKFKLSNMIDFLPDTGKIAGFVGKIGKSLGSAAGTIGEAVKGPWGMAIGAAVAVSAAPVLTNALSAAISAGAGMAVIGGGIALAVKNDAGIQEAGKQAGLKFMKSLGESVKVYTGPIRASLGIVGDFADRMGTRLKDTFQKTAGFIVPLVRDIVQGVERFGNSILGIAEDSGPALAGFGDMFRLVMDGVADSLEAMTENSAEAGSALVTIGGVIGDLIRYTGEAVGWINKMSNAIPGIIPLKRHYQETADASDTLKDSTANMTVKLTAAEQAASGERKAFSDLNKELKAQIDPAFGVLKAQEDLAEAQDKTAEATKKHGRDSKEAKSALRDQAMAALELEGQVGKLGDKFNGKMTPAMRNTLEAAGLTKDAIKRLEGQFSDARRTGDKFAKKYEAKAQVNGIKKAENDLYGLRRIANAIDGTVVRVAMQITGQSNVSAAAAAVRKQYAHGGITGAASGGIRNNLTWVGENGPELVELPPSTMVRPNGESKRMVEQSRGQGGAGGGSPLAVTLTFDPSGAPDVISAFAKMIRGYVRDEGGNVQQVFGLAGS